MWEFIILIIILFFIYIFYNDVSKKIIRYKEIQVEEINKINKEAHERELTAMAQQRAAAEQELNNLATMLGEQTKLLQENLDTQNEVLQQQLELNKKRIDEAFTSYVENLEQHLCCEEDRFDSTLQEFETDLAKIQATRAALIEAALREKEIQEESEFYKISINEVDLADIIVLEEVKPRVRRPEVLSKLIWTTYYQKGTTTLCNNVVGDKVRCGVYKLTDTTTGLAYIGQSVDIAKRFVTHIKNALGAVSGPIPSNKLYSQMRESGVHNFTFEIIEDTPREQLNEKERYYIEIYQTSTFGLNGNKGGSK